MPMVDPTLVGHSTGPVVYDVELWHVQRFAASIGDDDPVYQDAAVAQAAGHRAIPAPPTFAAALRPEDPRSDLGLDFRRVLHGEQAFEYQRPLYVGDVVHVTARISEMYEKSGKSGAMTFIVMTVEGRLPGGELVYSGRSVTVLRP